MSKTKLIAGLALALIVVSSWRVWHHHSLNQGGNNSSSSSKTQVFNKKIYSTDKADSLWVVVNKDRVLPSSYAPTNLVTPNLPLRLSANDSEMHIRADAAAALERLFAAATTDGIRLRLSSGYRSYPDQEQLYKFFVEVQGLGAADESSARPGHSEHQTGLAADIAPVSGSCDVASCFASTPEGQWLSTNSYKYGFIVRYRPGTQAIVGYEFEPWHIRYVGAELAAQLQANGQTMEQFFGLPPAPNYVPISRQLSL